MNSAHPGLRPLTPPRVIAKQLEHRALQLDKEHKLYMFLGWKIPEFDLKVGVFPKQSEPEEAYCEQTWTKKTAKNIGWYQFEDITKLSDFIFTMFHTQSKGGCMTTATTP